MWLVVVERTKVGWTTSRKLEQDADAEDEVHALVLVDGLMEMLMRMRMILICMRLTDERWRMRWCYYDANYVVANANATTQRRG